MPPLDEGDLLYMPTTDPSISVLKSRELLQQTDKLITTFPEVVTVHGKIGRAETATDPAPLSMIETVVQLKPDRSKPGASAPSAVSRRLARLARVALRPFLARASAPSPWRS